MMKFRKTIYGMMFSAVLGMLTYTAHASSDFTPNTVDYVTIGGLDYIEASGMFSGELERSDYSLGTFEVPSVALFPVNDCNGTAIVDVVNSVLFEFPPSEELGHFTLPFGRAFLGDEFIAGRGTGQGFTYLSVEWHKLVADETGIGQIERGTNGYGILAEAAEFLRAGNGDYGLQTCAVQNVLAFGWSQTGKLLAHLLTDDLNEGANGPIFDGLFLGVAGGRCRNMTDDVPYPWSYHDCIDPPAVHVPTVAYNTESEIELSFGTGALRSPTDNLHIYDQAGVAHIDAQFLPYAVVFADLAEALGIEFMQNPVSVVPGVRAAFWALYNQVQYGKEPPQSRLMHAELVAGPPVEFVDRRENPTLLTWSGGDVYSADSDGDGVADGGVRMPHMPTMLNGGHELGAPLGLYSGIDFRFAGGGGIFLANGGTFNEFSEAEISELYPNHAIYVNDVWRAVQKLIHEGYLLPEDGRSLVDAAVASDIGK